MVLRPLHAFLVSFALGFIAGFVVGGAIGSLFGAGLSVGIVGGFLVGIVFGVIGLGFFYAAKALGRNGLLAVAAAIFILGLVTIQPEIDALALVPLAIALFGVGRKG